jgi:UDP-glucose 4-epimerase
LETASLRFFNVFGPRQDPKSAYAAAVPIFMRQAFSNSEITIFGDGEQTRDLVYVKDVVAALGYVGDRHDMHGTYNVGYGTSKSIKNLAALIIQLSGSTSQLLHQEDRIGDVKHSCASIDKLLASGFTHARTFEKGISETLDFFRPSRDR